MTPGPVAAFELDVERRMVRNARGEAGLSPLGCRLLRALSVQPGSTVSREDLIRELWAGNHFVGEPALNRLVSETRRALRSIGDEPAIETVQRSGYRLTLATAPVASMPPAPTQWPWRRIALWLAVFVIVAVLAKVVMDEAIGFLWVLRHG